LTCDSGKGPGMAPHFVTFFQSTKKELLKNFPDVRAPGKVFFQIFGRVTGHFGRGAGGGVSLAPRGGGTGGGDGGCCGVCIYISREGAKPICLTMCELIAKVSRIMRECGVPMTRARIRYVRLHCQVKHLYGRKCARLCDVRLCVAILMEDWLHHRTSYPREPTRELLHHIWMLEMDISAHRNTEYFRTQIRTLFN
jgi:hypothetical protein